MVAAQKCGVMLPAFPQPWSSAAMAEAAASAHACHQEAAFPHLSHPLPGHEVRQAGTTCSGWVKPSTGRHPVAGKSIQRVHSSWLDGAWGKGHGNLGKHQGKQ